jgi:hypothetical protein
MAGLLLAGALVLYAFNDKQVREINLFALVLIVQSVPFIAAAGLAFIERSRLNDFAYWQALEARARQLLPQGLVARFGKPAVAPAPVSAPVTQQSDIAP